MNERIRELAEQANFRSPLLLRHLGNVDALTDSEQEELEIIEKFSELIVQDCLGVLKRRFMGDLNREDSEVKRCIKDVKKHFGVEE